MALIVSRCSDFESKIVRWFNHVENTCNTFARQALPMTWDYFELNPFSHASQGTFKSMFRQILRALSGVINTFSYRQPSPNRLQHPYPIQMSILTQFLQIHPTTIMYHIRIFQTSSMFG